MELKHVYPSGAALRARNKQRRVYLAVVSALKETGQSPTIREIKDRSLISSTSVVKYHLERLVKNGKLVQIGEDGSGRTSRAYYPPALLEIIQNWAEAEHQQLTGARNDQRTAG